MFSLWKFHPGTEIAFIVSSDANLLTHESIEF